MKHKILITALIAIGFSLSGVSHALSVLKPDGTRSVANVEGNKLMLRDATGKLWLLASDGTYKTDDGRTLFVKGGIIGAQSGSGGPPRIETGGIAPIDNKAKAGLIGPNSSPAKAGIIGPSSSPAKAVIIGPMNPGPGKLLPAVQPSVPGMGSPAATQGGNPIAPNKLKDMGDAAKPMFNPPPRVPERITSDLKRPRLPVAPVAVAPGGCPDPTITLRVRYGGADNIWLDAVIHNNGSVPFISQSTQQMVTFYHGERVLLSRPWGVWQIPPGANIFENHIVHWDRASEFPAGFTAAIIYDPDIFIDGNPQNDDCVMTNNKSSVTVDEVRRVLSGAGR